MIIYLPDELDEVDRIWNTHQIRSKPAHGVHRGRSILMYSMPQLYAAEDRLQCVLPETVFELCILLMAENVWSPPMDAYSATELYSLLRNEILEISKISQCSFCFYVRTV